MACWRWLGAAELYSLFVSLLGYLISTLSTLTSPNIDQNRLYSVRGNLHGVTAQSVLIIATTLITSGYGDLTQGRIAAAHGSFSRIRWMALMCTFFGLTRVYLPNNISIGSAVSAAELTGVPNQHKHRRGRNVRRL